MDRVAADMETYEYIYEEKKYGHGERGDMGVRLYFYGFPRRLREIYPDRNEHEKHAQRNQEVSEREQ